MRIIAGKLKGLNLNLPKDKNTRPLKDMARESIFNLIIHSKKILSQLDRINVLDLYAGTGSFGLECLSRNAGNVFFVENNKDALEILEKNIEKSQFKNKTKIYFGDVFKILNTNFFKTKFDIIFCDPPFKDSGLEELLKLILNKKLLNKSGIVILHRNKNVKEKLPIFFRIIEERSYGISKIIFGNFFS